MKPSIDVILNLKARHLGEASALRADIVAAALGAGARLHETRSVAELDAIAREITTRGTDGVVLAGGDGSHMAGLSALARARPGAELPVVALAPGGTVCTVARNFGMRGDRRRWAERIVRAACEDSPRVQSRPTLRVRDDAGGDRVGFIFGTGLVARFFELYDVAPAQGLVPAAQLAGRIFTGALVGSRLSQRVLEPQTCTVSVDGVPHPSRKWSLVLASAVRDVGLHFIVTYRAAEEAERFHVVASGLRPRALAAQAARALTGRPLRGEPHVDTLARSLAVQLDPEGGAYVLDGDLLRAGVVEISAGPRVPFVVA